MNGLYHSDIYYTLFSFLECVAVGVSHGISLSQASSNERESPSDEDRPIVVRRFDSKI